VNKRIVVLPDAGPENPFQYEMVRLLRKQGFEVSISPKYTLLSTFRALVRSKPDVLYYDWVHSFIIGQSAWWSYFKSLIFVLEICYARMAGVRIVHTLHNLQNHAGLFLGLERVVYRFFLKRCHAIRVYNDNTKAAAVQKFGLDASRISVVQDLPFHYFYKNEINQIEAKKQLQLSENQFVYLFFGEIKPYKGLDNFLPIFLANASPTDRLVIAGKSYDSAYFAQLQALGQNDPRISWHHRFIADDEVQVFFNAAHVVVLPFVRIDHSGSVDLAMSFSRPVITLRTAAMLHLLAHQSSLLFDDKNGLADCLIQAKNIDQEAIGRQNYQIADSTNYQDIMGLFV
jgi:beta-1,4-mannosyltransferase